VTFPTTAKPTTAVYGSGLTFGANLQSLIALTEGQGSPVCVGPTGQNGVIAQPSLLGGLGGGTDFTAYCASFNGGPPSWVSNGFTGFGNIIHFDHSVMPLQFAGCGFPAPSNNAAARTIACVFRHNTTMYNRTSNINEGIPLVQSGHSGGTGLALLSPTLSSITNADKLHLIFTGGNNITDPIIPFEIQANHWYAAAVSISTPSGGTAVKTFYLYDYTNQSFHPASGLTMYDTSVGYFATTSLWLAGFGNDEQNNVFVGDFAAVSLHNEAWNASQFSSYVADPISPGRGTYTASGSLTASIGRYWDSEINQTQISWPTFTGVGTGGGTGSPAYTCWWAASPTITPGSAGSTQLSSGAISTISGNTILVTDATLYGYVGVPGRWYTLVGTDGTQVLNVSAVYGRVKSKPTIGVGISGDSKQQIQGVANYFIDASIADNRKMKLVNWARGGAGLNVYTGNNLTDWGVSNVITASQQVYTLSYKNGSVTGGTFNLIQPVASPITISGIAWNTTSSALQTAFNAAFGSGAFTVTGGPLNTTAITVTGAGGAYSNAASVMPVFDLAGSALTGATPTLANEPVVVATVQTVAANPGTTANNLYTQFIAESNRVGIQWVIFQNCANDTATSGWQALLSAQLADVLSRGWKPLVRYPQVRRATGIFDAAQPATDAAWWAFVPYMKAAVAANPGSFMGSETNFQFSSQNFNQVLYPDGVHEQTNSHFAAAVGFQEYLELINTFEPVMRVIGN
jgi:hypothetical protein